MPLPSSHKPPTRLAALLCFAGVGWIVSACGSDKATAVCSAAPASVSVIVSVHDSVTGRAAADGAIGTLVGEGLDDTLINADSLTLVGGDQTGTFAVTIDRPGYFTWIASDVRVTDRGPCDNVIAVQLNARLQPETP